MEARAEPFVVVVHVPAYWAITGPEKGTGSFLFQTFIGCYLWCNQVTSDSPNSLKLVITNIHAFWGWAAFYPCRLLGKPAIPFAAPSKGTREQPQIQSWQGSALVRSALLLSLLHTFLPRSIFEEPSKLISPGQRLRGGGGEGRECRRGKKCSRFALCWFKVWIIAA